MKPRRLLIALMAAVLPAVASLACGGDMSGPAPNAAIRAINRADGRVLELFIRDCGAASWGPDRLGQAVIPVGDSVDFSVVGGCHDGRAIVFAAPPPTTDLDTLVEAGIQVATGGLFRWLITAAGDDGPGPDPE